MFGQHYPSCTYHDTHTLAPSAPTIVSVDAVSSTSILVQWNASEKDGGSLITGYVVEYQKASDPTSSFETRVVRHDVFSIIVDELIPSTEYVVRLRGENEVGRSDPSVTKTTKTDGELIETSYCQVFVRGNGTLQATRC